MIETTEPPIDRSMEHPSRRTFIKTVGATTAIGASVRPAWADQSNDAIRIDPSPRHELSPYLYMQFMEPLGATDGSVEAAWDHGKNRWRLDVIRATQELAPTMVRWGGIYTDYYRWREGVGPREQRKPMLNLLWGGIESNQVGTAELVDFCQQVHAEPMICVNFESDGGRRYFKSGDNVRTADAQEAADWVAYCNDPDHAERTSHGGEAAYGIKHWQIGNETSYDRKGFDLETAARKTVEFAKAMRGSDPSIRLIGWGGRDGKGKYWGERMAEVAGEHLQYLAFHHMFNPDDRRKPVLGNLQYRQDPDRAWAQLMTAVAQHERKIIEAREAMPSSDIPLAMTECHFAIPDRDRCDVLSTWAAGVAYARMLNLHQRHGDVLKIATAADFCGNRWQVNAVMIPTPIGKGQAILMPVARVMSLYRQHVGKQFVDVSNSPDGLDVTGSRSGDQYFLHVVNTKRKQSVRAEIQIGASKIENGKVFEIAVDPEHEITRFRRKSLDPVEKTWNRGTTWEFPPASVSVVEIKV